MGNQYYNSTVVLGMGPTGLGVARALGRNGISILGLDYDSRSPSLKSKYIQPILCPHPIHQSDDLVKVMYTIGKKLQHKAVLFPTSDEFVMFVSSFRDQLAKYFLFAMPAHRVVKDLLDKRETHILADKYTVSQPETYHFFPKEKIGRVANTICYPVFIKPCLTYNWNLKGYESKGVIANDSSQLKQQLARFFNSNIEVIVQSVVQGPAQNLYEVCCYFDKNREYRTGFVKRKLRQFPVDFGLGSYEESIKEPELLKNSEEFLKHLRYVGPAEIEYKKDTRDGKFKLIEINPRLPLQNSLAESSGINFPLIQYADLVGEKVQIPSEYTEGTKWIWVEIDLQSFLELRSRGTSTLSEWIRSVFNADEYALFSWRDPGPFLRSVNYGLGIFKLPQTFLRKKNASH